jgi:hypothetical protein
MNATNLNKARVLDALYSSIAVRALARADYESSGRGEANPLADQHARALEAAEAAVLAAVDQVLLAEDAELLAKIEETREQTVATEGCFIFSPAGGGRALRGPPTFHAPRFIQESLDENVAQRSQLLEAQSAWRERIAELIRTGRRLTQ